MRKASSILVPTILLLALLGIIIAGVSLGATSDGYHRTAELLLLEPEMTFPERIQTAPDEDNYPIDSRFSIIGVEVEPLAECHTLELVEAFMSVNGDWEDSVPEWAKKYAVESFPERGGDHNAFGMVLGEEGEVLGTGSVYVFAWPDGSDERTAERSGWANIPMFAKYNIATQQGPYSWGPKNGNKLLHLGLPDGNHVSFFGVWAPIDTVPTPTPIPTIASTPTRIPDVTPTPTPTPKPTSECAGFGIHVEKTTCSICLCLTW